jgi:hypothetical protein
LFFIARFQDQEKFNAVMPDFIEEWVSNMKKIGKGTPLHKTHGPSTTNNKSPSIKIISLPQVNGEWCMVRNAVATVAKNKSAKLFHIPPLRHGKWPSIRDPRPTVLAP